MKQSYYSSLFSMVSQIAQAVPVANGLNYSIINPLFSRVGIIFDNISAGKLDPGQFYKKHSRVDAEGSNEPPVLCQSTFL